MADEIDLGIEGIGPATLLARGGSAFVYLAEQTDFARKVAVKVLFNALENDATYNRFDRECRAIGAVSDHPNIVVVHGRGLTADERPYLVMEHRAGGSLAEALTLRGRFTEAESIRIGIKIGTALDVAHRAGVLHRDVKPANILLSSYNEPALADFGIARIEGGHKTTEGVFSASVVHASREVLDSGDPTPRSDVYALGSTLYELVTGSPAFADPDDLSMWSIINRVLSQDPPDPTESGVSSGLAAVLAKAMNHDPELRHATAGEFVSDLEALQSGPGIANQPTGVLPAVGDSTEQQPRLDQSRAKADERSPIAAAGTAATAASATGLVDSVTVSNSISRAAVALSVAAVAAVTIAAIGIAIGRVEGPAAEVTVTAQASAEGGEPESDSSRSERQSVVTMVETTEQAGGVDQTIAAIAGATEPLELLFRRAEFGPLTGGELYLLPIIGGPDGAQYRIVVDGRPVTELRGSVPPYYPKPGRHRLQVQAVADQRVELSNVIEIYVSDEGPETGFRVNLSSIRSEPENWPEALRQFDQMLADGHERLELSLSTRREPNQLRSYWNFYVDGFGDDQASAQAYCDQFDLRPKACFVAKV